MRVTTFVIFWRFVGAAGVGAGTGAAIAGLFAVLTGRAFAPGNPWLTALPVLAAFGALLGLGVARLTRFWLLPRVDRRRMLWGALAGAVVVPLAVAVGSLGDPPTAGLLLMLAGAAAAATVWVRWYRATHPTPGTRLRVVRTQPAANRTR